MSTAADETATWTLTGAPPTLCSALHYAGQETGVSVVGAFCGHSTTFGLGAGTPTVPIVLLNTTDEPAAMTLTRTE